MPKHWHRVQSGFYQAMIRGRTIQIANMEGRGWKYRGLGAHWIVRETGRYAVKELAACWTFAEAKQWVSDNIERGGQT